MGIFETELVDFKIIHLQEKEKLVSLQQQQQQYIATLRQQQAAAIQQQAAAMQKHTTAKQHTITDQKTLSADQPKAKLKEKQIKHTCNQKSVHCPQKKAKQQLSSSYYKSAKNDSAVYPQKAVEKELAALHQNVVRLEAASVQQSAAATVKKESAADSINFQPAVEKECASVLQQNAVKESKEFQKCASKKESVSAVKDSTDATGQNGFVSAPLFNDIKATAGLLLPVIKKELVSVQQNAAVQISCERHARISKSRECSPRPESSSNHHDEKQRECSPRPESRLKQHANTTGRKKTVRIQETAVSR